VTDEQASVRYVARPDVLAELTDGVLIKRGSVELLLAGPAIAEILSALLDAYSDGPLSLDELLERFPSALHETVSTLFEALAARRLLEPEATPQFDVDLESRSELFFWDHSVAPAQLTEQLAARRFVVLGVNSVATALVNSLREAGFEKVTTVDVPNLRNVRFGRVGSGVNRTHLTQDGPTHVSMQEFVDSGDEFDCLVATSDLGGAQLLRQWNRFAHSAGVAFFPVVLQNMRGFMGPLSIPGATACYECFRARQNSNMNDPELQRSSEYVAHETQLGVSALPSMAASLGHLAALELTKFFISRIAGWQVGTVYEINMLDLSLTRRRVLRVPRCTVCDRRQQQSATSLDEKLFTPHQARGE